MDITLVGALVAVVACSFVFFVWRQAANKSSKTPRTQHSAPGPKTAAAPKTKKKPRAAPAQTASPFRATAIKPGLYACQQVLDMEGRRFLSSTDAVPTLPLADCDARECTCKYVKYDDRRDSLSTDRRAIGGLHQDLLSRAVEEDRREPKAGGRRADD